MTTKVQKLQNDAVKIAGVLPFVKLIKYHSSLQFNARHSGKKP